MFKSSEWRYKKSLLNGFLNSLGRSKILDLHTTPSFGSSGFSETPSCSEESDGVNRSDCYVNMSTGIVESLCTNWWSKRGLAACKISTRLTQLQTCHMFIRAQEHHFWASVLFSYLRFQVIQELIREVETIASPQRRNHWTLTKSASIIGTSIQRHASC